MKKTAKKPTKNKAPAAKGKTRFLLFSFGEHEWATDEGFDEAAAIAAILRRIKDVGWTAAPKQSTSELRDVDPSTVDAFFKWLGEALEDEGVEGVSAKVLRAVKGSLVERLKKDAMTFVRGSMIPFEGNHHDTEIVVELRAALS